VITPRSGKSLIGSERQKETRVKSYGEALETLGIGLLLQLFFVAFPVIFRKGEVTKKRTHELRIIG